MYPEWLHGDHGVDSVNLLMDETPRDALYRVFPGATVVLGKDWLDVDLN
jgi:hypothetical protein